MITSFGKALRKIRIDNGEVLKIMAEKLYVTSSFLSAVENGKKKIPDHWLATLVSIYNLNNTQIEELEFAFSETNETIKIQLDGLDTENKKLVFAFARRLDKFDENELEKLKSLLYIGDNN